MPLGRRLPVRLELGKQIANSKPVRAVTNFFASKGNRYDVGDYAANGLGVSGRGTGETNQS